MSDVRDDHIITEADKVADTEFQKCPGCGGNMSFDPEKQMLSCPYCGQVVDFKKDANVLERDIEDAFSAAEKWDETSVVSCDNCGAQFVISSSDVAVECPYCETSHVRKSADLAGIKPNAVYPFLLTAEKAESLSKKWAKRRLFAPRRFKKSIEARSIHGVFQPFFTFDSHTFSNYVGKIGQRRTRTVRTKNGTRTETYIQWYNVSGTYSHFFDDITISAGRDISQKDYEKISPFKIDTLKVYSKDYLAGFTAKHYEKDLKTAWNEAKQTMDNRLRQLILAKYNCDEVAYLNVQTSHSDCTFKYVLMPVYILNYHYKKKIYRIAINGNTGKVAGKTPISFWKVLIAILIGLGFLVAISLLIVNTDAEVTFEFLSKGAKLLNNL